MEYLFGHIPDYPLIRGDDGLILQAHSSDAALFHASAVAAAAPLTTADSIDHSDRLDAVQSQRGGTCVGYAESSALFLGAQLAGTPIRRPSPTLIVAMAQLKANPGQPIDCYGCQPTIAAENLADRGVVAVDEWPETTETLVTIPAEEIWARAEGATAQGVYRVPNGTDESIVEGMKQALRRGLCPPFGMMVDDKYAQIGSGIYDGRGGTELGLHMQVVVGWSAIMQAFKVLNSWGTTFGAGGFAWISAQVMARLTFDRLVIPVVPREV